MQKNYFVVVIIKVIKVINIDVIEMMTPVFGPIAAPFILFYSVHIHIILGQIIKGGIDLRW
jgi:hypothetical protein